MHRVKELAAGAVAFALFAFIVFACWEGLAWASMAGRGSVFCDVFECDSSPSVADGLSP
jgi:hypothetical protein